MTSGQGTRGRSLSGELLSPSRVGGLNRSRVIQALCDYGPLSRADLAKMAGVTRATIGNIVRGLVDAEILEDGEPRDTGRVGKPARPVWFAPRAALSGAVVIGGGTFEAALVNARGELLSRVTGEFDAEDPTGEACVDAVHDGLGEALEGSEDLLGVGVAVPGVCDPSTGEVLGSGQVPGLRGTALADELGEAFGTRPLVDNDSRAQALGEKWFGAGRGYRTFASIRTGYGLGVGLVVDGAIYRGRSGEAGELGHTCVVTDGERCRCGLSGCWETIATLRWLRAEAARRGVPNPRRLGAERLVELAADADEARGLLSEYADNLAIGIANLTQILNPGRFILHGDVVGGGETLRRLIEERARGRALPNLRPGVEVLLSELDRRAGLLGAAGLVLSETFQLTT